MPDCKQRLTIFKTLSMEKISSSYLVASGLNLARLTTGIYNWFNKNISVAYLIILLFGYTAFSKLDFFSEGKFIDVSRFEGAMFKSPILRPYVYELGYIIPFAELAICFLLAFRKTKLIGYYSSLVLLLAFTSYISYSMIVLPFLPCTCGGVISSLSWKNHLVLNFGFLILTTRAIYLMHKRK